MSPEIKTPTNPETSPAGQCGSLSVIAGSASFRILKQALEDDAFEGGEVAQFDDHSVSWNTRENIVAIADSCGWWVMPAHTLKAIAAATPNGAGQTRRESDSRNLK